MGAPPLRRVSSAGTCINIISAAYKDAQQLHPMDESLISASTLAKISARTQAAIEGNVPGVVGDIAEHAYIAEQALRRATAPEAARIGRGLTQTIKKELPALTYVGPAQNKGLVATIGDKMLMEHPDWFSGRSVGLDALLQENAALGRGKYGLLQALDYPTEPLVDNYLMHIFEPPSSPLTSRVNLYPPGRVSVTRGRILPDYVDAVTSGLTPKEMSVGELIERSAALVDQAIGDAIQRRLILERFGKAGTSAPFAGDYVPFNSPLYRGFTGPREIVNFVDQLSGIPGAGTRQAVHIASTVKNSVFGIDFGVFGVQGLRALTTGGPKIFAGLVNRGLAALKLPHFNIWLDQNLPRSLQAATRGGVELGLGPSVVT